MWTKAKETQCPECDQLGVEQIIITDEAWTDYIVVERHDCGWTKVYLPEHQWAIDESTS